MDDADSRGEAQFESAMADGERVLRVLDASADHGVNVHVEGGVFGEELQLLVEDLEALLGDLVGLDVNDRDLHVIESGLVEALDAVGHEEVAVGDHSGNAAVMADASDYLVELGMSERLAAGDGDDAGSEAGAGGDAVKHLVERHRL